MHRRAAWLLVFWLVSGVFVGIGALAANPAPVPEHEDTFVARIGDERSAAGGLDGFVVAADLVDVARHHAEEMQAEQRLFHNPDLGDDVQGWQRVGENVGRGGDVEDIHRAFMASPSHRDNIVSPTFTQVGVGVVVDEDDGEIWVVQVFRTPDSAAASSPEPRSPEPAPSGGGSDGGGGVRAAGAGSHAGGGTGSPSTAAPSAPAPPTTAVARPVSLAAGEARARAGAPAVTAATSTTPTPVAPSSVGDGALAAAIAESSHGVVADAGAAPFAVAPSRIGIARAPDAGEREVTWSVAVAASMLVLVVGGLAVHVGENQVRSLVVTGRASFLDVWELALAR